MLEQRAFSTLGVGRWAGALFFVTEMMVKGQKPWHCNFLFEQKWIYQVKRFGSEKIVPEPRRFPHRIAEGHGQSGFKSLVSYVASTAMK